MYIYIYMSLRTRHVVSMIAISDTYCFMVLDVSEMRLDMLLKK